MTVVALLVVGACVLGVVKVVYAIKRMDEDKERQTRG